MIAVDQEFFWSAVAGGFAQVSMVLMANLQKLRKMYETEMKYFNCGILPPVKRLLSTNNTSPVAKFRRPYSTIPTLSNFRTIRHSAAASNQSKHNRGRPNGDAPIPWNIYGVMWFLENSHYHYFMVVVLSSRIVEIVFMVYTRSGW